MHLLSVVIIIWNKEIECKINVDFKYNVIKTKVIKNPLKIIIVQFKTGNSV